MKKGFPNVVIILAIVILVGIGGYFVLKQNTTPTVTQTSALLTLPPTTGNTQKGSYSILEQDPLIEKYGKYPSLVFKNYPKILESLKQLDDKFTDLDMDVSFGENKVVTFTDGRKMLFLSGCFPHACAGSEKMVLYDPTANKVYVSTYTFVPKDSNTPHLGGKNSIVFLGDPDSLVIKFLSENYHPQFLFPDIP